MTKAIFWDNDGILVDTERLYFEVTRDILATVGVDLSREQYVDLFMVHSTGAWHLAQAMGLSDSVVDQLRVTRDRHYCERLAEAPLVMPGVVEVLEALHGKYRMGIVTSAYKEHFDIVHQRTGLLTYFDFALTGADFTNVKPHPEPYLRALAFCEASAEECLAVEDSERGLRSAQAAGIRCAVLPNPLAAGSWFDSADHVLSHLTEIIEVVTR